MRVFVILLLSIVGCSWAEDTQAQAKVKIDGYLKRMAALEPRIAAFQPKQIPLAGRTAQQNREITQAIEALDTLIAKEVKPLVRDAYGYHAPGKWDSSRRAAEALDGWSDAKLQLQNAGINNPSLENLRKNEPVAHKAFLDLLKQAQQDLKGAP